MREYTELEKLAVKGNPRKIWMRRLTDSWNQCPNKQTKGQSILSVQREHFSSQMEGSEKAILGLAISNE